MIARELSRGLRWLNTISVHCGKEGADGEATIGLFASLQRAIYGEAFL